MPSATIETMQVRKKTGKGTALINKEDFDPELHEELPANKGGRVRKFLAADASVIAPREATLDAAAVKELGPPRSKEEKDALDNAKIVREPTPAKKKGAAATALGGGQPAGAVVAADDDETARDLKSDLIGVNKDATTTDLSPVGEKVPVGGSTAPEKKTGHK